MRARHALIADREPARGGAQEAVDDAAHGAIDADGERGSRPARRRDDERAGCV